MTGLSPEICYKIRDTRRAAKLSQSAIAKEVGCKQSALSMFEQGDGTKLNEEVINKLSKKFSIDLVKTSTVSDCNVSASLVIPSVPHHGFCPNPRCPSNHAYEVSGRTLFNPDREVADPAGGKFCAMCGELLERVCPNCGSPVHAGAICSLCGEPYVAVM